MPSPAGSGCGVGELETTCQWAGAVTVNVKRGLEVGLLEHGEHPPGVGHLELRVEVDLVVDRVDEAVQALAGVACSARCGDDHELVVGGQIGQAHPAVGEDLGRVERRCR